MWFWKKKEEPKVEQEEIQTPLQPASLTFELYRDGNVIIGCSWPIPESTDDAKNIIQGFSQLIVATQTGELLSSVQQAIACFESNNHVHKNMAKAILGCVQAILQDKGILELPNSEDAPVVCPTEAFQVRGGN